MKRRHALAALVIFALGGCATAPPGSQAQVDFEIINDLIPPGPATIYLLTRVGSEREIGIVSGGTRVLRYQGLALKGEYQLVAKRGERIIYSPILVLERVLALRWDLERNYIQVTRVEDQP
ncbi:MAG TPA: hypothetical protein VF021_03665 [Longimicrobiales bacterium]